MNSTCFNVSIENNIAHLVLNRPEKRNSMVPEFWDELPKIIHKINSLTDKYDKFVAIGAIIKGGTDHYEYISQGVIDGLIKLTIDKNVYIANCVLNVHDINDAYDRSKENASNKGSQAAFAINNLFT